MTDQAEAEERAREPEEQRDPEKREPEKRRKKKRKVAAPSALPSRFRFVWITLAALYLVTVWLDGVGSTWPAKITPRPWLYFSQVAALFVNAAPKVIDYRAEGWSCSEHRWTEIDVRPYFRIDADNKENRFQRALQFYRKNRTVMRALEDFIVKRHNANGGAIGGVRFSSLRLPYPKPGEHVNAFEQKPLASYSGEQKHDWYWTPGSRRAQRCNQATSNDGPREDGAREDGVPAKDTDTRETDP